ncbi:hypothetical protein HHK36_015459 [Tetracentron sinense]|uniref:AIPP2-like SPOC-like domain-containing protein n=1 Tax=Tetracentron sinense TaxID=13715 RepID=A0A834Z989_TETSI|nr:hypothetical protein HHK36_015459 [Tetracentron sinense]
MQAKPCDICGDFGFVESLSTCFQCNMACEHVYCMQTCLRDVPKLWFCEPCRSNNGIVSTKSGAKECLLKASISDSFGVVSQENEDSNAPFPPKMVYHDALRSVGPSIHPGDARMWFPCEKQRAVETANVNILPAEEAILLSSGAKTKSSPLWGGLGSRTGPSDTVPSISSNPVVSTTVPPKCFVLKGNANPSSRPSIHSEPLTLGSVQTSTTLPQRAVQNSKPLKDGESPQHFPSKCSTSERSTNIKGEEDRPGIPFAPAVESEPSSCKVLPQTNLRSVDAKIHSPLKHIGGSEPKSGIHAKEAPAVPRNGSVCKEEPIDAVMPAKEVGTLNAKTERGTFCTGAKPQTFDVQERDLPRILPGFEKYLPNPPSQAASWEGSFEILDAVSPSKFYDGFLAHHPGVVSRKAYEFSKQLPGVLKFKVHPRCDVWPEIFQMDCPGGHDVALYILPGDFERSKQMYACLLEFIEKHDLVLQSCFDGVELLITTSKHLCVDSQTPWKNEASRRDVMTSRMVPTPERSALSFTFHRGGRGGGRGSFRGRGNRVGNYMDGLHRGEVAQVDIEVILVIQTSLEILLPTLPQPAANSGSTPAPTSQLVSRDDMASLRRDLDDMRLNMQFYLWGIYRCVKGSKSFYDEHGLLSSYASPTGHLHKGHLVLREDCSDCAITNKKENAEVVDMEIDMIGGKDVGRVDTPVPRYILPGNEVQYKLQIPKEIVQFKPQEFVTSSNALELYNIHKFLYKRGDGSTRGGTSSSFNICSQVNIHKPNEGAVAQHLPEVKKEQISELGAPPGFSREVTTGASRERTLRKSPLQLPTVLGYLDSTVTQPVLEVKREQYKWP